MKFGYYDDKNKEYVVNGWKCGPTSFHFDEISLEYWEANGFVQIRESRRKDARLVITGEQQYDWTYSRNWALAKADEKVSNAIGTMKVVKEIYVKGKLVNIVVKP